MNRIFNWYNNLTKRVRDSVVVSASLVGMLSTVLSILGISLGDLGKTTIWVRTGIVIASFILLCIAAYVIIGRIFREHVNLSIRQTDVSVKCGDIFNADGLRVIGCDTHFDIRADDIVIAKKSLHGQLF